MTTPRSSTTTDSATALERLNVNLTPRTRDALDKVMGCGSGSKTEVINRALQVYAFLEEITRKGGAIYVRDGEDAELERIRFF